MLIVYLRQGYFDCIEPSGKVIPTHFRDVDCCIGSLFYDSSIVAGLEPIEEFYQAAVARGYPGGDIIDKILRHYHRFRYFRIGYLSNRELTVGFIGHRGSGKSVAAAAMAIVDFLLAGYSVWSNMPVRIVAVYGNAFKVFEALPLDKLELLQKDESFRRGVVVLDEVNVSLADAAMYMSKTNRELSNFSQQIRKRGISIVWTAQNWNTVDPRLKFQTDYAVWCEDCYLRYPGVSRYMGEVSHWAVMDTSGMSGTLSLEDELRTKWLIDRIVWTGTFHMRPWWEAYNTYTAQGGEYSMKVMEEEKRALRDTVGDYRLPADTPIDRIISEILERKVEKIYSNAFWAANNITDRAVQTKIGMAIVKAGYEKRRDGSNQYFWEFRGN